MKKFLTLILCLLGWPVFSQPIIQPSAIGRSLIRATDAANARAALGVNATTTSGWPQYTPWATVGTFDTNSTPWICRDTSIIATTTNTEFPSVVYDAPRKRIIAAFIASSDHFGTNGICWFSDSYDGGITWDNFRQENLFPGDGVPHASLTALRDGSLLLNVVRRTYQGKEEIPGNAVYSDPINLLSTDGGQTWITNSTISAPTDKYWNASDSLVETPAGTWLKCFYDPVTVSNAVVLRSTDRGANWSEVQLDPHGSEANIVIHPNGTLFALVRQDANGTSPKILTSTNDGESWREVGLADIGTVDGINNQLSFPCAVFHGNRLLMSGRDNPAGNCILYWNDSYPYINGWHAAYKETMPSLYDAAVNLSPTVSLWVSAYSLTNTVANSLHNTPIVLRSVIIANDGEGFTKPDYKSLSQPSIALFRDDLPANGRITIWPNLGTIPDSPTNTSASGAIATYISGVDRAAWSLGSNNVHFASSNYLQNFWQTNVGTIIFRMARTNNGDNCYVLANQNDSATQKGFSLRLFGKAIKLDVSNGTEFAAKYATSVGLLRASYDLTPTVVAVTITNEQMWVWQDGIQCNTISTNSTGSKTYSTSDDALFHLSVGTFGFTASEAGTASFLTDVIAFTNALSRDETYQWMERIR